MLTTLVLLLAIFAGLAAYRVGHARGRAIRDDETKAVQWRSFDMGWVEAQGTNRDLRGPALRRLRRKWTRSGRVPCSN